jgi:signal recognition particle receptor subunit beta
VNRSSNEVPDNARVLYKALVLGANAALQTGFLNIASEGTVAYQLHSTVGVGIGVSRSRLNDGGEAVLQLWALPTTERFPGLIQTFMRGHRGAIIVLRPEEADSFEGLHRILTDRSRTILLVAIVGNGRVAKQAIEQIVQVLGNQPTIHHLESVGATIDSFAAMLHGCDDSKAAFPCIALLNEDACPAQEPILSPNQLPPNSKEEMSIIRENAESFGVASTSTHCILELDEGIVKVELSMGDVVLEPVICDYCLKKCARRSKICIVGTDAGWSSEDLSVRALLTMAKIYALATREIPDHVEKQLYQASRCSRIELPHDLGSKPQLEQRLAKLGYIKRGVSWTLLDEANRRRQDGRLSETDYESIARRFQSQETADQ